MTRHSTTLTSIGVQQEYSRLWGIEAFIHKGEVWIETGTVFEGNFLDGSKLIGLSPDETDHFAGVLAKLAAEVRAQGSTSPDIPLPCAGEGKAA